MLYINYHKLTSNKFFIKPWFFSISNNTTWTYRRVCLSLYDNKTELKQITQFTNLIQQNNIFMCYMYELILLNTNFDINQIIEKLKIEIIKSKISLPDLLELYMQTEYSAFIISDKYYVKQMYLKVESKIRYILHINEIYIKYLSQITDMNQNEKKIIKKQIIINNLNLLKLIDNYYFISEYLKFEIFNKEVFNNFYYNCITEIEDYKINNINNITISNFNIVNLNNKPKMINIMVTLISNRLFIFAKKT